MIYVYFHFSSFCGCVTEATKTERETRRLGHQNKSGRLPTSVCPSKFWHCPLFILNTVADRKTRLIFFSERNLALAAQFFIAAIALRRSVTGAALNYFFLRCKILFFVVGQWTNFFYVLLQHPSAHTHFLEKRVRPRRNSSSSKEKNCLP